MLHWIRKNRLFLGLLFGFGLLTLFGLPTINPVEEIAAVESADTDDSPNLTYLLDWSWGNAERVPAGGWRTINDLGYEIYVTNGYLVSRSAELIPCKTETASLLDWLVPQTASAGHPDGENDESIISAPYVESLLDVKSAVLDSVYTPAAIYCEAHYLLAEGIPTANNLPTDTNMVGTTLWLEGTYLQDGNTMPFTIQTNLAWGINTEIVATVAESQVATSVVSGAVPISLTLTRSLDTLFDGVDFSTQDESQKARAVLRSLVNNTVVSIN